VKKHIFTFSNLTLKYFVFTFLVGFGILFWGCKPKEIEPDYVLIPDVIFEEELVKLRIDNFIDGKVMKDSALKVKSLSLRLGSSNEPISNLSGIEAFINLEFLDCSQHGLTNLDVEAV
jgi:hypothetical protein